MARFRTAEEREELELKIEREEQDDAKYPEPNGGGWAKDIDEFGED